MIAEYMVTFPGYTLHRPTETDTQTAHDTVTADIDIHTHTQHTNNTTKPILAAPGTDDASVRIFGSFFSSTK